MGGTNRRHQRPSRWEMKKMPAAAEAEAKKPGAVQTKFCCQTDTQRRPCWLAIATETPMVFTRKYTPVNAVRLRTILAPLSGASPSTAWCATAAAAQAMAQVATLKKTL